MEASDPIVLLPPVEHHKWKEAPEFLRQLILLLERCWPSQLHLSGLREYHPFLYTLLVCSSIATVFFVSFFFVHVALYRRLACHYPILQVLFRRKESGAHHDRHGDEHGRSRPHRASATTTFRPSKFATASRSSRSYTTLRHSFPFATPRTPSTLPSAATPTHEDHRSTATPPNTPPCTATITHEDLPSSITPLITHPCLTTSTHEDFPSCVTPPITHPCATTPTHEIFSSSVTPPIAHPCATTHTHEDLPSSVTPPITHPCATTLTHEDLPSSVTPPITHPCATTPTHEDLPFSVTPPITHPCATTPTHEDLPSSLTPPITHPCATTFTHEDLPSIPSTTLLTCLGAAEDLSFNSTTTIASIGAAALPNKDSPTTPTNGSNDFSSSEGVTAAVWAGKGGECPAEHTPADR